MARLRDIPHVYRTVGPWTFAKRVYNQTYEDNLLVWAAALAYSWLFALFPFLIFCLSLVPLMPDRVKPSSQTILTSLEDVLITGQDFSEAAKPVIEEVASPEVEAEAVPTTQPATRPTTAPSESAAAGSGGPDDLRSPDPLADPLEQRDSRPRVSRSDAADDARMVAAEAAEAAEDDPPADEQPASVISDTVVKLVSDLMNRPTSGLLTLSLVIALFTASGGMAMTMAGLDKCYDVAWEKMRPIWKSRPVAILLTVVLVILILATITIIPIGQAILDLIARGSIGPIDLGWVSFWGRPLRWVVGLLLLFAALAVTYKFGPSIKTRLHLFSPGSIFAVAMWILTAIGFRIYIDSFGAADSYARTYGAVAGVALLMLLFYLDALFLLIGAEINAEIDFIRLGIRSGPLPEESEVAPIPTYQLDDEDRELKAELEERRSVDEAMGVEPRKRGELGEQFEKSS